MADACPLSIHAELFIPLPVCLRLRSTSACTSSIRDSPAYRWTSDIARWKRASADISSLGGRLDVGVGWEMHAASARIDQRRTGRTRAW